LRIADWEKGLPNPQSAIRNPQLTVLDLLSRLVSKSLVVVEPPQHPNPSTPQHPNTPTPERLNARTPERLNTRYRLLETIRQYAAERLDEAGETEGATSRHLDYYTRLAEEAEPELTGMRQIEWLARLDAEYGNFRTALDWSLAQKDEGGRRKDEGGTASPSSFILHPSSLRLVSALGRFWQIRGYFSEGRHWLDRALRHSQSAVHDGGPEAVGVPRGRPHSAVGRQEAAPSSAPIQAGLNAQRSTLNAQLAKALSWAGFLAVFQGDYAEACRLGEESLALYRELGDQAGMAGTLGCLGIAAKDRGDADEAWRLFQESLALWREVGDRQGIASTLGYFGILAANLGEHTAARGYYEESLALRRELGDRWGIAASLNNLGLLALSREDYGTARSLLEESLAIRRELRDRRCIAITLNNLGRIACHDGDFSTARALWAESLDLAWAIGERRSLAYLLESFAHLAAAHEDWQRVARLCGAAEALREAIHSPLPLADRATYDPLVTDARSVLGDEIISAEWSQGRQMPLEQAIAYALGAGDNVSRGEVP
jgi:tetratricopeptide (TPR) repeat protein